MITTQQGMEAKKRRRAETQTEAHHLVTVSRDSNLFTICSTVFLGLGVDIVINPARRVHDAT